MVRAASKGGKKRGLVLSVWSCACSVLQPDLACTGLITMQMVSRRCCEWQVTPRSSPVGFLETRRSLNFRGKSGKRTFGQDSSPRREFHLLDQVTAGRYLQRIIPGIRRDSRALLRHRRTIPSRLFLAFHDLAQHNINFSGNFAALTIICAC